VKRYCGLVSIGANSAGLDGLAGYAPTVRVAGFAGCDQAARVDFDERLASGGAAQATCPGAIKVANDTE
jgi:hypothetical protein